ncbi:2-hydroxycarboxylate transporter family protein, partial [Bacillus sp. SS-TM]
LQTTGQHKVIGNERQRSGDYADINTESALTPRSLRDTRRMNIFPFKDVAAVLSVGYVVVCASVVLTMVASGFLVGKVMKMYPVESAIVTGCHSGLGGTGDVAILSASNRMELMPFAQISTRLGGAAMVVTATILLKMFS